MNNRATHFLNTMLVLVIFCLFAVCSLFAVLIGANVYHEMVGSMDANSEVRTSLSYVSNKVRAADSRDVAVRKIGGQQALVINGRYNGENFKTYIYTYKGYLLELFTKAENPFTPGDGDKITRILGFSMSKTGNRLILSATGENRKTSALGLVLP